MTVSRGLEVKLTHSSREFQKAFAPFNPSVVAFDLQLPGVPWYELLYWISETTAPPGRMSGPRRAIKDTREYALTLTASR